MEEKFTAPSRPGPRPVGCLLLEHAVPSLLPETPVHLLAQGPGSWGPQGRKSGSASYLTLCLRTTIPPTNGTTNGRSLTVGCLWEGPTMAVISGWRGPLMVAHWSWLLVGGVFWQAWTNGRAGLLMVLGNCCRVTGEGSVTVNSHSRVLRASISPHFWLTGKGLMLGKIESKRRGWQVRWLHSIMDSMDINLSKL